jgi:two-component system sensor histidine kinase UhpB
MRRSDLRKISFWRYVEAALLTSGALLVSVIVFAWEEATRNQIPILFYLLLPLWLWASVRFSVGGIGFSLLIVGMVATWFAVHGQGTFTSSSTLGSVLYLQVFLCVMSLPFLTLAAVLAQHRETARSLRESRARLIDSQERERRRLARELHDGIGQSLALLESELAQFTDESENFAKPRLQEFLREVSDIAKVTREISHGLHPSHLEHLGLTGALKKLCRDFSQGPSLSASLVEADLPQPLPSDISLALYRVAQEAMHNVEKYSRARRVEIRLNIVAGQLRMQIVDDGVGFAPARMSLTGIGIASMKERMELIGGTIEITSAPMKGTIVEAAVPIDSAA